MHLPFFEELEAAVLNARETIGLRPFSWPPLVIGITLLFIAFAFFPAQVVFSLSLALFLAPLWLPLLLGGAAWTLWLIMRRSQFIASQKYVLLEIKLPRNLVKTPLAMEAVLSNIHYSKGESSWYQRFIQGQVRPYWSLEIASFGGDIHFYIWTRANFRKLVENAFYAQYPGVQLIETVDYTRLITATPEEWSVWGLDYKHTKPDPFPIRTYVDYGLDKAQEEAEQIDPFSHIIELLGSIGKGEYLWLQFIIRIHTGDRYHEKLNAEGKPYTWKDLALEEVEKIRKRAGTKSKFFDPTSGKMIETEGFPNPTKGQSETIAAIERNVSKLAFDVGARAIYIADPARFDAINITAMINLFKPFSSEAWNGIKGTHFGMEYNDYPWEIGNERRKDVFRREVVEAYRRRQYFHEPFVKSNPMVMSTEELATVFHIPSSTVAAPGLQRIPSTTSEAPANLPI